jgi:hypothetical protein
MAKASGTRSNELSGSLIPGWLAGRHAEVAIGEIDDSEAKPTEGRRSLVEQSEEAFVQFAWMISSNDRGNEADFDCGGLT